jgi:hypothetical protein
VGGETNHDLDYASVKPHGIKNSNLICGDLFEAISDCIWLIFVPTANRRIVAPTVCFTRDASSSKEEQLCYTTKRCQNPIFTEIYLTRSKLPLVSLEKQLIAYS